MMALACSFGFIHDGMGCSPFWTAKDSSICIRAQVSGRFASFSSHSRYSTSIDL